MSTEAPNPTPTPTTTILPPDNGGAPPVNKEAPIVDPAKSGDQPAPKVEGGDDQLLFKPKVDGDKKPDDKAPDDKPKDAPKLTTADDQKKFLTDKKLDPKLMEGKTDAEIQKLYDEQLAKDAAEAEANAGPTVDFEKLTVPDDTKVTPENMDWVKKYSADNKLTQEQTQALLDKGVEMHKQNIDFWNNTKKGWLAEVKADPTIGGANLDKTVANVEDVIQKFGANKEFGGSPELVQALQQDLMLLGLGVKKSFIQFMANVHKATSDDTFNGKGGSNPPKKDLASRMYPNMKSEF